jgi:hypothetical protein
LDKKMTPHKHAELIKQWADGAKIEFLGPLDTKWTLTIKPKWAEDVQYRVAPKLKAFNVKLTKTIEVIVTAGNASDAAEKAYVEDRRHTRNDILWAQAGSQAASVSRVVK